MFLKPKEGLVVRDPNDMLPLPKEGKEVHGNLSFWVRRLEDGDVIEVKRPAATEKPAAKPAAPEKALASETSSQTKNQGDKT